ncbi:hypothetical protein H0H92_008293 [Tricholoma furcatifolium]|nr:hypothetical protein H0H92_008293 [Tricholoma furcatifolium]
MRQPENVAIFWDLERLPPHSSASGYTTVEKIRSMAHAFGSVISFKAYVEISSTLTLWTELQSSGVSLTYCPNDGRRAVTDTMLIVDMVTFAMDHPSSATIFLISNNLDLAYAVSTLRHRKHNVVVMCPTDTPASLFAHANAHLNWNEMFVGEPDTSEPPVTPPAHRTSRSVNEASRMTTPLDSKGKQTESLTNDTESNFRVPHHPINGFGDRQEISLHHRDTGSQWRAPSRATSRPHSPGSFRSANSSPLYMDDRLEHTTLVTNGNIVFQRSSLPELPKGFPYAPNGAIQEMNVHPTVPAANRDSIVNTSDPTQLSPRDVISNGTPLVSVAPPFIPATQSMHSPAPAPPPVQVAMLAKPISTLASVTPPSPNACSGIPEPNVLRSQFATPAATTKALTSTSKIQPLQSPESKPSVTKSVAPHFKPLIQALQKRTEGKNSNRVSRADLGGDLAKIKDLYSKANVKKFASYILLAEDADVVELGGDGSTAWVSLCPQWSNLKL